MSTVISTPMQTVAPAPPAQVPAPPRADVIVEPQMIIPGWVNSLAEYRRWSESDAYPRSGWVSFLDGVIWVDPSMEEFLTHNQIKQAFGGMFFTLLSQYSVGRFVPDRMLLVNEAANLSTEPDGLFYLWETMQSGRLRLAPGKVTGYMQLEGTPDGVLEIVSDSSEVKDLVRLRELYWKAQIPEYWIVDARADPVRFDILRHTIEAYEPTPMQEGWVRSAVLGHSFRIERSDDPLGLPHYVIQVKTE